MRKIQVGKASLALSLSIFVAACGQQTATTAPSKPVEEQAGMMWSRVVGQPQALKQPGAIGALGYMSDGFLMERYASNLTDWVQMDASENDSVSYKLYAFDSFAGFTHDFIDAKNGESWSGQILNSYGAQVGWTNPITFYTKLSDTQVNCFNSASWSKPVCGSNSIRIQHYWGTKCREPGVYKIKVVGAGQTKEESFRIVSGVKFSDNWLKNQLSSLNSYGDPGMDKKTGYTIKSHGCAMTSAAMVLNFWGVPTNPIELNEWLRSNNGYSGNAVIWGKVSAFAKTVYGREIKYSADRNADTPPGNRYSLDQAVCKFGPVVTSVRNGGHFVIALGRSADGSTINIGDPLGGIYSSLSKYGNTFSGVRMFSANRNNSPVNKRAISIFMHSPAEVVVTDPNGNRVGYDVKTTTRFDDVSSAYYDVFGIEDADTGISSHVIKELTITDPVPGGYTITTTGTGTGAYKLDIRSFDSEANETPIVYDDVATSSGQVHVYRMNYSDDPSRSTGMAGSYPGSGTEAGDINYYLSYSDINASSTTLPRGTTAYKLKVSYGLNINASTFKAISNKKDITSLFNPVPGGTETVAIPVVSGLNTITLQVDSPSTTKTVLRDIDKFSVTVQ